MIGELATSKAGHDKDRLYLIIGEEGDSVFLCDGRLRGVTNPKKKKKKHIQIIHFAAKAELMQKVQQPAADREEEINEQIRSHLKEYHDRVELLQLLRSMNKN